MLSAMPAPAPPLLGRPPPPLRTVSAEHLEVQSPTPDTHTLPDGAVCRNVERLEQSAEELSQSGSDINEEIRKLVSRSRSPSLAAFDEQQQRPLSSAFSSTKHNITSNPSHGLRSRTASSSTNNSILDTNRDARLGFYSPTAFVNSPPASFMSISSSPNRPEPVLEGRPLDSPLASLHRRPSAAASRHSSARGAPLGLGLDEPSPQEQDQEQDQKQDQADNMADDGQTDIPAENTATRPGSSDTYRQASVLFHDFDGVHFSPTNAEFVETDQAGNELRRIPLHEADDHLLQHPDLTAHASAAPQSAPAPVAPPATRRLSYMPAFAHPPPAENMVYYPAPVPRMLNLPKRLSTRPDSTLIAARKSQMMLPSQPAPARKSVMSLAAPHVGGFGFERNRNSRITLDELEPQPEPQTELQPAENEDAGEADHANVDAQSRRSASPERLATSPSRPTLLQSRASMASMANLPPPISQLPPQLRASLFFDHPATRQSVHIQSESAVATLDSILQASATAPVSVFTDHPFVGSEGARIYARERKPKQKRNASSMLLTDLNAARPKAERRRSLSVMLTDATKPREDRHDLPRRSSVMSLFTDFGNTKALMRRNSRMSLASTSALDMNQSTGRPRSYSAGAALELTDQDPDRYDDENDPDEEEEEDDEGDADMGPVYAQPTTLLAELQLRKVQQKSRNRTAANAFPNGMHSTLLELDAVAQIEEKKRKKHKVALAWEEPSLAVQEDEEPDEDVPLGVLFPAKNGRVRKKPGESDWDRPLGLIERRQLEDNEPLSSRRNRILGIPAPRAQSRLTLPLSRRNSMPLSAGDLSGSSRGPSPGLADDPDDDLPLAERKRRIQQKATLDSALGDVTKDNRSTFESEVLSVFGVPAATKPSSGGDDGKENLESETLGQRRARLQREKSGLTGPAGDPTAAANRPALRNSMSLANLLAAAPLSSGATDRDAARRLASSPAPGTLLGNHAEHAARHREDLRARNARTSSYADLKVAFQAQQQQQQRLEAAQRQQLLTSLAASQSMPNGFFANGFQQQQQPMAQTPMQAQQLQQLQQMQHLQMLQQQQQQMAYQAQMQQVASPAGQMINPLAFAPFVPPVAQTGMGFAGGMAAGAMYQPSMPMMMTQGAASAYNLGSAPGHQGMAMGAAMAMGYRGDMWQTASMDPAQRDVIDRWRSGIAQ